MAKSIQQQWFVREWLEALNLRQVDLVERTGIAKGQISLLLSGKRRFNSDHLFDFAEAMGIEPGLLLINPTSIEGEMIRAAMNVPDDKRLIAVDILSGLGRSAPKKSA